MSPLQNLRSKRFYMVRHGQTVSNAARCASGALDTPLTDLGREQAKRLAPLVEKLLPKPMLIVHSHLSRARDTAGLLNGAVSLPMVERASLAEQDFGDWVGKPWSDVKNWMNEGRDPQNGETQSAFGKRVMLGVAEACTLAEFVLIVTHGGVFHALAAQFGFRFPSIRNCELYEFSPAAGAEAFPWEVRRAFLTTAGTLMREPVSAVSQSAEESQT